MDITMHTANRCVRIEMTVEEAHHLCRWSQPDYADHARAFRAHLRAVLSACDDPGADLPAGRRTRSGSKPPSK